MREEKLEGLLNELAQRTAEPVRPGLDEDIKQHIPQQLSPHRGGMDTVNIIIDLRINKLAAAAVIVITLVLLANLFGGKDLTGDGIYHNGKLLMKYCLGAVTSKSDVSAVRVRYEYLLQQGKEAAYYGDSIDPADSNEVRMQWKLSDGNYRVIFGDLREKTITAEELVKLQARMLQKKAK